MKFAVITDAHGNLPALQVALAALADEGCDAIYHTGDAIGIGPYPAETLDLLLHTPRLHCLMGNHDALFAEGLPAPRPAWMSEGELLHQHWVHAQLDPALRPVVAGWSYAIEQNIDGLRLAFVHYGLDASQRAFAPIIRQPETGDLDALFSHLHADLVFYGHHHPASDQRGRSRYLNPGALGCFTAPVARFALCEIHADGRYSLMQHSVPYDDAALFHAFEQRRVPEREFIVRAFFGRS